jgi:transcriptional regulator with XRE-family HTH domain
MRSASTDNSRAPVSDDAVSDAAPIGVDHLTARVAERVRSMRMAAGLSLDALAQASGVSRSMISAIERAESNATAIVLDRLASALDVSLTHLLEASSERAPVVPRVRRDAQPLWRDPASGYERRALSPPLPDTRLRLVEVRFPPGARVAYESAGKALTPIEQQVWLLSGTMRVTVGAQVHELAVGDCLAMRVDRPIVFHNPGDKVARYLVAQA